MGVLLTSNMFVKGQSGNPTGKVPGTKNKRTRRLMDLLGDAGFNYAKEFVKAFKNLPEEKQFEELKYILPYVSPQYLPMADAPSTLEESLDNANAYWEKLKEKEGSNAVNP